MSLLMYIFCTYIVDYPRQDLPMVQQFTRTTCGFLLAMMVTKGTCIYVVKLYVFL